jgi:hypothetical protein
VDNSSFLIVLTIQLTVIYKSRKDNRISPIQCFEYFVTLEARTVCLELAFAVVVVTVEVKASEKEKARLTLNY